MDQVVSRMMRLLGVLNVLGPTIAGISAAQGKDWFEAIIYLLFAVVSAGIFTLIWTIFESNMDGLLGKRKREEFTSQSTVGVSVAILALFTSVGFITAGLSAAWAGDSFYGRWGFALSTISTGILAIIWTIAEYNYVQACKNRG